MKMSIEMRADLLKTLMIEDRQEIRGIRSSIYRLTTLLATAPFAITAFLLGGDQVLPVSSLTCSTIDGLFVFLVWAIFWRLKCDLYRARQCLTARQKMIGEVETVFAIDLFNPFPDARNQTPDVKDSELWFLPILATVVIVIKALVVYHQFSHKMVTAAVCCPH